MAFVKVEHHNRTEIATSRPNAVVTSVHHTTGHSRDTASALRRHGCKHGDDTDDGSKQTDERSSRSDGRETAEALLAGSTISRSLTRSMARLTASSRSKSQFLSGQSTSVQFADHRCTLAARLPITMAIGPWRLHLRRAERPLMSRSASFFAAARTRIAETAAWHERR